MNRMPPIGLAWLLSGILAQAEPPTLPDLAAYAGAIEKWEPHIARLEELDRTKSDPNDAVFLLGSSSIRLWETAEQDLAPYPIIRRGYGGARFSDAAYFAERLITPHQFRATVVFVANDVQGKPSDATPAEVGEWFGYIADRLRHHQPEAPVICCDIRATTARWACWDKTQAANAALRAECDKRPGVHYLDTRAEFLTADWSAARGDLYTNDGLHLNRAGNAEWGRLIHAKLDEVLNPVLSPSND